MRRHNLGASILGVVAAALVVATAGDANSAQPAPYAGIPVDQAEKISTPAAIISQVTSGAPTAIWATLEHGEKVECLQCIPVVAPLLYDVNAKNREIAAWWLRRRIFGVFGPGQVYQQTINNLATNSNPVIRGYAASALGEFLDSAGIAPLATALTSDSNAGVRAAAASALGRLDDDGSGAISTAFSDSDPTVRQAALVAASRITAFVDAASASKLLGDSSPLVRRWAVMLLDQMRATDTVASVLSLAQTDSDSEVRLEACHALGDFGNTSVQAALDNIANNDSVLQVRDQAHIASLKL
jgi:hypothetical protein